MPIVFCDSFDHLATADLPKKYASAGSTVTVGATSGRNGTAGYRSTSVNVTTSALTVAPGNQPTLYAEVALRFGALPGADITCISFSDAGVIQCDLRLTATGELRVTRNGTSLNVTSGLGLIATTYYHIGFMATISDAAGVYEVRVNGVTKLSATAVDTKNTANAYANQVVLFGVTTSGTDYDDLIISTDGFSGDCRVKALFPQAAGSYTQWTPSPSYDAPQGTGDRTGSVTANSAGFTVTGTNAQLVDGLDVDVNTTTVGIRIPTGAALTSSVWVQFDFGAGRIVNEARVWNGLGLSYNGAQWKWQGSNDASAWTDIGSSFTLSWATSRLHTNTAMSANTTAWRYYRMVGVSGTPAASTVNLTEFEFNVSGAVPYRCVDEPVMNSDTDYVTSATAGQRNSYDFAAVGVTGSVKAVQHVVAMRKDDAGSRTARMTAGSSEGPDIAVTDTYVMQRRMMTVSPGTGSGWTTGEIDATEFGSLLVS